MRVTVLRHSCDVASTLALSTGSERGLCALPRARKRIWRRVRFPPSYRNGFVGGALTARIGFHAVLAEINVASELAHKIDVNVSRAVRHARARGREATRANRWDAG